MSRVRILGGVALAAALVFPLAGCAGKVRIDMSKMCAAHGGTWQASDETCNPGPGGKKAAKAMCESNGGVYLPGGMCEMEGAK